MSRKHGVGEIIGALSGTADLGRVESEYRLSVLQILRTLDSTQGKKMMRARRRLARIHRELIAHVYSAYAVQKICALLNAERPEHVLKGALAVLEIVKGRGKEGGKGYREVELSEEETKALWKVAEEMVRVRGERRRGNSEC